MTQSPALEAMQFARDALELDGEAAFDAACQVVEDVGAWDFECWPYSLVDLIKKVNSAGYRRAGQLEAVRWMAQVGMVSADEARELLE